MTVREVVMRAAEELRIVTEVANYFDGVDLRGEEKAKLLLTCFNMVESELALDYLPLTAEEKINSISGQIQYSQLKNAPVRIVQVRNANGEAIEFKLFAQYLQAQKGALTVVYTYTPAEKDIHGDCAFPAHIAGRLMVYGIAAEYAMAMGEFSESALWDKKYKDAIEAAYEMKSGGKMPSRRWA